MSFVKDSNDHEEGGAHIHHNYSLLVDRKPVVAVEGERGCDVDSEDDQYFRQFRDFSDPSAEILNIVPCLSNGVQLDGISSFRNNQNMYARAVNHLVKPVLLELIKVAEGFGCENLYMFIQNDLGSFLDVFQILAYIGFTQVQPEEQRVLTSAPGILMNLKLKSN